MSNDNIDLLETYLGKLKVIEGVTPEEYKKKSENCEAEFAPKEGETSSEKN